MAAYFIGKPMQSVGWIGDLFLNLLKMMVVPLVFFSITSGITYIGDIRRLGKTGTLTFVYYMLTTAISVTVGLILVNIIKPGKYIKGTADGEIVEVAKKQIDISDIILSFISDNIVDSMAKMEMLPIIIFSLLFGAALTTVDVGKQVTNTISTLNETMLKMVMWVMELAPIGIFALVAAKFAEAGSIAALTKSLGIYMITVILGLAIHGGIILPLFLKFSSKKILKYFSDVSPALITAFSTASSSATLPLTLECVTKEAKVKQDSALFVLPVGATINMDGTALYEAVAALFIAQAYGVELSITQQIVIFLTATLAAIGAAGIPQAGLVTMVIVLKAVNLPLEGISLILAVDWLLDRFRTTINVWGDTVGAAVVEKVTHTSKQNV